MAHQTAVEWLIDQLKIRGYAGEFPPHLLFEQAKQMEKEQAFQSFKAGQDSMEEGGKNFEQYYGKYNSNKLDKK